MGVQIQNTWKTSKLGKEVYYVISFLKTKLYLSLSISVLFLILNILCSLFDCLFNYCSLSVIFTYFFSQSQWIFSVNCCLNFIAPKNLQVYNPFPLYTFIPTSFIIFSKMTWNTYTEFFVCQLSLIIMPNTLKSKMNLLIKC